MLAAAPKVADALITAHREKRTPDDAARAAYAAVWCVPESRRILAARGSSPRRSRETVLQREFALFGGEFLLTLGAKDLRAWFAAFFAVDEDVWGGFLGGWPGLPGNHHHETRIGRLLFGLALLPRLPPSVALKLAAFVADYSLNHGLGLLRSLAPVFGDGEYFRVDEHERPPVGDLVVKAEIRERVAAARHYYL